MADGDNNSKIPTEVLIDISNTARDVKRILQHHKEFKDRFTSVDKAFKDIFDLIHIEKVDRMESDSLISDKMNVRTVKIYATIIGLFGLFSGVIIWLSRT